MPENGAKFFLGGCDLHRNYHMLVILLSFLCNYDNLTPKLHQEKRSYPHEGWFFIGRFKVGSVPGMSVALEASKKYQNPSIIKENHVTVVNSPIYKTAK